jgi:hypothetical protein
LDVVKIPAKFIVGFSVFSFSHPENMKTEGKKRVLVQPPHHECELLPIFYWKILVIAVHSKTKENEIKVSDEFLGSQPNIREVDDK